MCILSNISIDFCDWSSHGCRSHLVALYRNCTHLALTVKCHDLASIISGSCHFIVVQEPSSVTTVPLAYRAGVPNFFSKGLDSKHFNLVSYMVSVATVQYYLCSAEAAKENILTYGNGYIHIKFYLQKMHDKTMGFIWPLLWKQSFLSLWITGVSLVSLFYYIFVKQSISQTLP